MAAYQQDTDELGIVQEPRGAGLPSVRDATGGRPADGERRPNAFGAVGKVLIASVLLVAELAWVAGLVIAFAWIIRAVS